VRLLKPTPVNLKKILALGPTLGQVLHLGDVRLTDTERGILIELPSPLPKTPSGTHLARDSQYLMVAIGLDQWRQPVLVDLRQHPTLLFVGPPRRGKTSAMKSILYALARQNPGEQLQHVIISQRRNDWVAFEHAVGCLGLVNDPAEALRVMEWGAGQLMAQRSARGIGGAAIVFILDDLTNLLKRVPEIAAPMGEMATMGGGVNLFQMIGTHHAGSKAGTGDTNLEASATARLVYKPSSTSTGARSAGVGGLGLEALSNHKGDCLLLLDGYPIRVATGYTDDRLIAQLPAGDGVVAPWRGFEQPTEQQEQAETGQNNGEQPNAPPHATGKSLDVAGFRREQTIEQLKEYNLGLSAARPPAMEEEAAIRKLHQIFLSIHKTVLAAYGHYNGKVRRYVLDVLWGIEESEATATELPSTIDLTTEAGCMTLTQLQTSSVMPQAAATPSHGLTRGQQKSGGQCELEDDGGGHCCRSVYGLVGGSGRPGLQREPDVGLAQY
jgi:hypothetical protein